MPERSTKPTQGDWSPLLRRVVLDDVRWPSRDAVRKLGDKDIAMLRKLAAEKEPASGIRLDKVLTTLVERAPDAETVKLLARVIADRERPSFHRMVAAIGLGRMPRATAAEAESLLLAHVADSDAAVAQRALQSLGKIGGEEGLANIEAMSPPRDIAARRQWEFSQRLIRHRLGKPAKTAPEVRGTTWDTEGPLKARPLPLNHIEPERLIASIEALRNELPGIELAGDRGYGIESDRSVQYLLLAKSLSTREGIKRLTETPMVAATIAIWEPRTHKAVLDQIVLTDPFAGKVLIQGFRPDGTLLFEGHATVRESAASFSIVNVDRSGQCRFHLAGQLKSSGLTAHAETMPRQQPRHTLSLLHATR